MRLIKFLFGLPIIIAAFYRGFAMHVNNTAAFLLLFLTEEMGITWKPEIYQHEFQRLRFCFISIFLVCSSPWIFYFMLV